MGQPVEHGVERDLLQHEAAASARVVQLVHIPLTKEIVRPFIDRMVEVVGAGIEGQFVELLGREHGVEQQRRVGGVENNQGGLDQFAILARSNPRPANPQRRRAHPLVVVRLDFLFRAEHGHRSMADEIVQLTDDGWHDPFGFLPRPPLLQHGLAHPADEKRLEQCLIRLME